MTLRFPVLSCSSSFLVALHFLGENRRTSPPDSGSEGLRIPYNGALNADNIP